MSESIRKPLQEIKVLILLRDHIDYLSTRKEPVENVKKIEEEEKQDTDCSTRKKETELIKNTVKVKDRVGCFESINRSDKKKRVLGHALSEMYSFATRLVESSRILTDKVNDARIALSKIDGRKDSLNLIPLLLRQGPCKKISKRSTNKPTLTRHLFLFSDYLILTEPANGSDRYQLKMEATYKEMTISDIDVDEDIREPHRFRIKSTAVSLDLAFENEEEKSAWKDEITAAIRVHQNNFRTNSISSTSLTTKTSAPVWVKDEHSTMCAYCSAKFTAIHRRHHCRACGRVFCVKCSDYRASVLSGDQKMERVCIVDYYILHPEIKPPTYEIARSIEQREQNDAPIHSSHLHWCQYLQGSWSTKSPPWASKSGSHRKVNVKTPVIHPSDLSCPSAVQTKSSGITTTPPPAPVDSGFDKERRRLSNRKDRTTQNHRSSPNLVAYLTRTYCILQPDSSLLLHAALADTRPNHRLTCIGMRLFYLDTASGSSNSSPASSPGMDRRRSASCVTLNNPRRVDSILPVLEIRTRPELESSANPSGRASPAMNPTFNGFSTLQRRMTTRLNSIDTGVSTLKSNPVYRNCKPPPLTPKPNSEKIAQFFAINTNNNQLVHSSIRSDSQPNHAQNDGWSFLPLLNEADESGGVLSKISPTESQMQLDSVSPDVLGLLQNDSGFLLLPFNTDSPAHYFEAPSVELRNKWMASICRACVEFLS